jgi:hypothetical protein
MSGLGYLLIAAWSLSGITAHKAAWDIQAISRDQRLHDSTDESEAVDENSGVHFSPAPELGASLVMIHLTIGRRLRAARPFSVADVSRVTECLGEQMRRIVEKVADTDSLECGAAAGGPPRF